MASLKVLTFWNSSGDLTVKWFFRKLGLIVGHDLLKSYLFSWMKRYTNLYEVIQT